MKSHYLYITLLGVLNFSTAAAKTPPAAAAPQLVVSIQVHGLRTDHLLAFAPLYSPDGLQRLIAEGRFYTNAAYAFDNVDPASATATIATGTTPYYHGITGSQWLDRETLRPRQAVYDAQKQAYGPEQLAVSTIGDELKVATDGIARVYAFATDAESAILSAGHAADAAAWIAGGRWTTTPYYAPADQWMSGYQRLYTPTADDANASITQAALACVRQAGIALDDKTDLISLTYTVEPQMESYVALDRQIADLTEGITAQVAPQRTLFVLTSTGERRKDNAPATPDPSAENQRFRIPTGRFSTQRATSLLNLYLGAVYGNEPWVECSYENQLYLNHKLLERRNIAAGELLRRAQEFLLQLQGVRNVWTAMQLMTSDSWQLQRVRNGFNVDKSGDLIVNIALGWQLDDETTQTTLLQRASNIPVPLIFWGADIQPQRVEEPVTTDHIAPTIARIIRIRAPNACAAVPLF